MPSCLEMAEEQNILELFWYFSLNIKILNELLLNICYQMGYKIYIDGKI